MKYGKQRSTLLSHPRAQSAHRVGRDPRAYRRSSRISRRPFREALAAVEEQHGQAMTYQFFHWHLIGLAGEVRSKEEKLGQLMPRG